MIRKLDYNKFLQRKNEIDELNTVLKIRYSGDAKILKKFSEEYTILMKLMQAVKKETTLEKAAIKAGTSPDSARRWINGKLPQYFAYALNRKMNLERLKQDETFIFLLGTYQSRILGEVSTKTFEFQTRDKTLSQTLENCLKKCFDDEAKITEGRNGFKLFKVNSKPLMTMIKNITYNNTTPPLTLLNTQNKNDFFYLAYLTNIKVNLEPQKRGPVLHASISRSRGNTIEYVHDYLDDKRIPHHYYKKEKKIRFRGKECLELAKILLKCESKEYIEQNKKYI